MIGTQNVFMVPFGLTEKQFVTKYRKCLEKASSSLINELRLLFTRTVPATVSKAEIVIFLGEDEPVRPDAEIYYTGLNNKVDRNDPSIFPGCGVDLNLGIKKPEDFDQRYFDDELFDGWNLIADTVKRWVAECWWKAGGWDYPVPVEGYVHDGYGDGEILHLTEKRFMNK